MDRRAALGSFAQVLHLSPCDESARWLATAGKRLGPTVIVVDIRFGSTRSWGLATAYRVSRTTVYFLAATSVRATRALKSVTSLLLSKPTIMASTEPRPIT